MNSLIEVTIVGAPVACTDGVKDIWREVADWARSQLRTRFDEQVQVAYFDLFDPECPSLPEDAQLPVVIVDGSVVSSGGKVSIPLIRKHVEELLS